MAGVGREHLAGGLEQRLPPGLGVLLGPHALDMQRHRPEGPRDHGAVLRHQRALAAAGAQVHRQYQRRSARRGHQNLRDTETTSVLLSCRFQPSPSGIMKSSGRWVRVATHSAVQFKPQR